MDELMFLECFTRLAVLKEMVFSITCYVDRSSYNDAEIYFTIYMLCLINVSNFNLINLFYLNVFPQSSCVNYSRPTALGVFWNIDKLSNVKIKTLVARIGRYIICCTVIKSLKEGGRLPTSKLVKNILSGVTVNIIRARCKTFHMNMNLLRCCAKSENGNL